MSTNIVPGIVVVPLNLPGPEYAGLTLTYDFKELIGAGGFGEVWRTLTRGTGNWNEHVTKVSYEPVDSDRVRLAFNGTRAIAAQKTHPHLCSVGIVSSCNGRLWVSSEMAEGNLADLATGSARLSDLVRYTQEAAAGLDHLHSCGLVHNHVKPSNILIVKGRARVSDFDLVHPLRPDVNSGWVVRYGDPTFLAPEVLAGQLSPSSDQFALACTYAVIRLGRPVFAVNTVQRKPDIDDLPAPERVVLARALSAKPDGRFPNCRAFVDALATTLDGRAHSRRPWWRFW